MHWEYMMLGPIRYANGVFIGDNPSLSLMTPDGREVDVIRAKGSLGEGDMLARTIALLGAEGWEMTGCGNVGDNQHVVYFKRPKP